MNYKQLRILERAFDYEIMHSMGLRSTHIFQTKSKLVNGLFKNGYLKKISQRYPESPWPCTVDGYELTHLGRMTYCEYANGLLSRNKGE